MGEQTNVETTGKVVEPKVESPETTIKVVSGLSRQIAQYQKSATAEPGERVEDTQKPPEPKKEFDYTVFKDLDDKDYDKYKDLKEKDEAVYYDLLNHRDSMKKNQRLLAEREKTINEMKSKITTPEDVEKMKEFVTGLKSDALGTYRRFQKDFDLPEPEFLERQVASGGSVEDRLSQWQEAELVPAIEKKFKIEEGTFTYDANEAFKVGTPSYEYRIKTEKQEKQMFSEYETSKAREIDILKKTKEQTDNDLLFLRQTYFPDSDFEVKDEQGNVDAEQAKAKAEEAFIASLNKLDEIQLKVKEGEFDAAQNPFALKNIYRGIFYDELVEKAVEKAVNDLHAQYNVKGLYLEGKPSPTDVNGIKGKAAVIETNPPKRFGMTARHIDRTLKTN